MSTKNIQRLRELTDSLIQKDVELAEYQFCLESFFTYAVHLIVLVNPDRTFKKVSDSWETTLGYTKEELYAQRWPFLVHPDDVVATAKTREVMRIQGLPLKDFQVRLKHKEGHYINTSWSSAMDPFTEVSFGIGIVL